MDQLNLVGPVTTLAQCFKITRLDGQQFFFTEAQIDIELDNQTYLAATCFKSSVINKNSGNDLATFDFEGVIDGISIIKDDVLRGKFSGAVVEIFLVDYMATSNARLNLKMGFIESIKVIDSLHQDNPRFLVEINSKLMRANSTKLQEFSPTCRAIFGDSRCGINVIALMRKGQITNITPNYEIYDSDRTEANGYFDGGHIRLAGSTNFLPIKRFYNRTIKLAELNQAEQIYNFQPRQSYEIVPGCNKTFENCKNFKNILNFRGEPHVPGLGVFYAR